MSGVPITPEIYLNKWLLINDGYHNGYYNMAADEEMLSFDKCVLRLYGFKPACITIGYFMDAEKTLNQNYLRSNNIDLTRRITGGKAVLHDDEITYSISAPLSYFGKSVLNAYNEVSNVLINTYNRIGINAAKNAENIKTDGNICFAEKSKYEILYNGKKIAGFAQKKCGDRILQHCSIPFTIDYTKLKNCFKNSETAGISELKTKFTSINELTEKNVNYNLFAGSFISSFKEHFNVDFIETDFSEENRENIRKRMQRKYIQNCWIQRK